MTRIVEGGVVELRGNQVTRTDVVSITFPNLQPGVAVVPAGAAGTMILRTPPPQIGHFNRGDQLDYADSNNNNNRTLTVTSNIGPSKYAIMA